MLGLSFSGVIRPEVGQVVTEAWSCLFSVVCFRFLRGKTLGQPKYLSHAIRVTSRGPWEVVGCSKRHTKSLASLWTDAIAQYPLDLEFQARHRRQRSNLQSMAQIMKLFLICCEDHSVHLNNRLESCNHAKDSSRLLTANGIQRILPRK